MSHGQGGPGWGNGGGNRPPPRRPAPTRHMPMAPGSEGPYGEPRLYGDRYGGGPEPQQPPPPGRYGPNDYGQPPHQPPGQQPPPGPPPPRPRKRRRVGRTLLIIFLAFLTLIGGIWIWLDTSLTRVEAITDYPGRPAEAAGVNWLIVGSDSREGMAAEEQEHLSTGDVGGKRTDTMMLLHVPDNSSKPTLVSLMRDSLVEIPGQGKSKKMLNSAYGIGGPKLLTQTVEKNTGLRIEHYMEIGLGGFAEIVDAVGGVDMCLDKPVNDPKAGINLKAGCQELDGPAALGYVRTRAVATNGVADDFGRTLRQRQFISALTDKVASPGTLLNPFRLFPLLGSAPEAITVDEGDHLHHLPSVAFAIAGASNGDTNTTIVPFTPKGARIEWHPTKSKQLFEALRTDAEVPKELIITGPAG
ncbi:LytR family transcriptional attenuator [Herbihabitans rhizosphaerae]|uniref:LytR family transcriptional attenuator n=1 Tax=Herbihabitans rhizosphaerae TaxID=1872711 RepID=A0A4Q7L3Q2_9PSEU|nr:LCP family protein [Herbihabitans rhizosphaerae]RZS43380.1 LytR family transcriptional attenuator [Herbihabitans rhizosphaerae]